MKTHEEIKKALKCCAARYRCWECPYNESDTGRGWGCNVKLNEDLLIYIQQLERERDAAVKDMNYIVRANDCAVCMFCAAKTIEDCSECRCDNEGFKWRGVPLEEKEDV